VSYLREQEGRTVSAMLGVALREVGDFANEDVAVVSDAPVLTHLARADGRIRTGALLALIDNVGGFCGGLGALPDGWVVSTNLAARTVPEALPADALHLEARVLRRGKSAVVTSVEARAGSATGPVVADAALTSAVLVPENGPPPWDRPAVLAVEPLVGDVPPLYEWIGVRALGDATVAVDVRDELRNPWGILHGGIVAALVDAAAEHEATAARGGEHVTADAVIHFLAPVRVGPVRATATPLGDRPDGRVARVELHDGGVDDRTVAVAVTTARPS
jgi:uncharacterized protein (TIGR00369 family)